MTNAFVPTTKRPTARIASFGVRRVGEYDCSMVVILEPSIVR